MSQLQHRNENQNFISDFVFQFIKKQNRVLGTRIIKRAVALLPRAYPQKKHKDTHYYEAYPI